MLLEKPSTLAQLPAPLGNGKIQCGTVHGLANSKKRKRYEIAAAIDGEAVNIYDVQSPKLLTSYAIPPQSSFTCPPCSTVISRPKKTRRTYFSLKSTPETQLKCIVEETGQSPAKFIESTRNLDDVENPVVSIDTLPVLEGKDSDIIVVYKDCGIQRLSSDIQEQRWRYSAGTIIDESAGKDLYSTAGAMFMISFEEAQKSIFRSREDLVAGLAGFGGGGVLGECSVMILVTRDRKSAEAQRPLYRLHFIAISHRRLEPGQPSQGASKDLKMLASFQLHAANDLPGNEAIEFSFNAPSGVLTMAHKQGLINFDLTKSSPIISSRFDDERETFTSITRISASLAVGASSTAVKAYDLNFKSLQGVLPLEEVSSVNRRKRKRGTTETNLQPIIFIDFFQGPKLLTAIQGCSIIAIDFSNIPSAFTSKQSSLIDSIGRGIHRADPDAKPPGDSSIGIVASTADSRDRTENAERLRQLAEKDGSLVGQQDILRAVSKSAWVRASDIVYCINRMIVDVSNEDKAFTRILLQLLRRLHTHALSSVVSALRQQMSHLQMLALINFLRQQLFLGGYTSSSNSQQPLDQVGNVIDADSKQDFLSLDAITGLLNSLIDAVGIVTWTSPSSENADEKGLVQDLRTEISLALTGVEEAAYLRGILREFLRYGQRSTNLEPLSEAAQMTSANEVPQKPGEIITLFDEGWDRPEEPNWLPLDLKGTKAKVSATKIRKGDGREMKRSKREMRYLESQKVGRYSLDRLVL